MTSQIKFSLFLDPLIRPRCEGTGKLCLHGITNAIARVAIGARFVKTLKISLESMGKSELKSDRLIPGCLIEAKFGFR